jgi:hypothetical protein
MWEKNIAESGVNITLGKAKYPQPLDGSTKNSRRLTQHFGVGVENEPEIKADKGFQRARCFKKYFSSEALL